MKSPRGGRDNRVPQEHRLRWLAKVREGGKDALAAKAIPGRPPKLAAKHLSRLYELIVGADPETACNRAGFFHDPNLAYSTA
jgi:transposase